MDISKLDLLSFQSLNFGGHGLVLRVGNADLLAQLRQPMRFERFYPTLRGREGGMSGTRLAEFGISSSRVITVSIDATVALWGCFGGLLPIIAASTSIVGVIAIGDGRV